MYYTIHYYLIDSEKFYANVTTPNCPVMILGPLAKIRGVAKKRHGHNNEFWGLKRIAGPPNHVRRPFYSFLTQELNIVAVSFFRNASFPAKKFSVFGNYEWYSAKKIQIILNRTILTLDALPIAHFEAYVPIFLKHMLTLAIPLKFWVPAQSKVGWSRIVILKKAVFWPLFWRKSLFWPISTQ